MVHLKWRLHSELYFNHQNKQASSDQQLEDSHGYVLPVNEGHDGLFTPSGVNLCPRRGLINWAGLWGKGGYGAL